MSDEPIDDLAVRRIEKMNDPAVTPISAVLDAAKAWCAESGADHVIIMVGRDAEGGGSATRYFQAGSYRHHAQMGLAWEGISMIRESE